jgi:anti-sigma regulatory factor (Ser/Thr protein kinase)
LEDLSLHILDISENAVSARAKRIEILLTRDAEKDLLRVEIKDDGSGMDGETLSKVRDPFFTTKGKKTGLGLPFLSQAAEQAGGEMSIASTPGKGTRVTATFQWGHVDRPPLGDMVGTIMTLIAGHPDVDVVYEEREGARAFRFDTREIKNDLDGVPINASPALEAIRGMLNENVILRT